MEKTNKKTLEEIIRVDHAGERGAIKIYEGQLLALKTFKQDEFLKKKIEEMKEHEKEHYEFFDKEIKKRNIKPTKLLPLWDIMGVTLGFGTAMLGEKAAMLCTASVEEVIDGHYKDQTFKLGDDEKELKEKIKKFRQDEFLKKKIEEMKEHEKEHYEFFDKEIKKRNIKPTKLLPLWDIMGVTLGFGTAMLGEKAAMLCTASVEEVIDGHYKDQTYKLGDDEKELKEKIKKFRDDELHHKDIAYDNGATKKGLFGVLDKVIKTSSRIAITISEKI